MTFVILFWDKKEKDDICLACDENGDALLYSTKEEAIRMVTAKQFEIQHYKVVEV